MSETCYRIDPVTGERTICEVETHLCPRCGKPIPKPDFDLGRKAVLMCMNCPREAQMERREKRKAEMKQRIAKTVVDAVKLGRVLLEYSRAGMIKDLDITTPARYVPMPSSLPLIVRFDFKGQTRYPNLSQLQRIQCGVPLTEIWHSPRGKAE